jgi:hypothetical protein
MWTRAALLAITGGVESQIQDYWRDLSTQACHTGIIQVGEKDDKNFLPMMRNMTLTDFN